MTADPDARAWIEAAALPEICAGLDAVYGMIADQVEARGPACWASGRCCNFANAGHLLYVTGLEAAWTLRESGRALHPSEIDAAQRAGGCPFQEANLCGVHTVRPLGCRVYFCDRSAQRWQEDLTERAHAAVRRLHETHDIPYVYAEWRGLLGRLTALAP